MMGRTIRSLSQVCLILVCADLLIRAQTASPLPVSLKQLGFLQGVWVGEAGSAAAGTTEFHGESRSGTAMLIGRHWINRDLGQAEPLCPWCVPDHAMLALYDFPTNQPTVHFSDGKGRMLDFHVAAVQPHSIRLLSDGTVDQEKYRLSIQSPGVDLLVITIELADQNGLFMKSEQWRLHRKMLSAGIH